MSPIKIREGEKIFGELDDVNELIFIREGSYKVGFTINNKEKYVISLPTKTYPAGSTILGGFECSYDKRSKFIYRSQNTLKGYFIRKQKWKKIADDFPEFYQDMRRKLLERYYNIILPLVKMAKNQEIEKYQNRADFK